MGTSPVNSTPSPHYTDPPVGGQQFVFIKRHVVIKSSDLLVKFRALPATLLSLLLLKHLKIKDIRFFI